jgi:hypothetical protein
MTGKEIANNLRNSKEAWTTGVLASIEELGEKPAFCVLGLKLYEAGIPLEELINTEEPNCNFPPILGSLMQLNDLSVDKDALIYQLDSNTWKDVDFPIEELVESLKKHA